MKVVTAYNYKCRLVLSEIERGSSSQGRSFKDVPLCFQIHSTTGNFLSLPTFVFLNNVIQMCILCACMCAYLRGAIADRLHIPIAMHR